VSPLFAASLNDKEFPNAFSVAGLK